MEYVIKEIKEEIDVMYLTEEEYNSVNKVYFDIMSKRNPRLLDRGIIGNIKRCILTDGLNRVEVLLLKNSEKEAGDKVLVSVPPTTESHHQPQQQQQQQQNSS